MHAAWDDTLQCRKAVRTLDEDLALLLEGSSHQPNLHKGCRRVPLNTCMFLTRLALTSLINKYGDAGMYPSCRRARQMLQGVGVTQSRGVDDTPMEPEAVEAAGRTGKKRNASAPGSSRQSTPIGSSKRRLYCFAERRAGKHWDLKSQ